MADDFILNSDLLSQLGPLPTPERFAEQHNDESCTHEIPRGCVLEFRRTWLQESALRLAGSNLRLVWLAIRGKRQELHRRICYDCFPERDELFARLPSLLLYPSDR